MTTVACVVVSFNTRDLLRACLRSVRAARPVEIVVVDNGSTDGTVEMLRREFPEVGLVLASNRGYGAAANEGFAASGAEYVLLLNSDTVLSADGIGALTRYLDGHPGVAMVGPRLRNPDGSLQRSCFAWLGTTRSFFEKTALASKLSRIPEIADRWFVHWSSHERARAVPWVLGAALLIRRAAFEEVGGFDETFFMYAEEVDLAYRLTAAGWQVHFCPEAEVVHIGGASTAQFGERMTLQRMQSALLFYRRHYSPMRVRVLTWLIGGARVFHLARAYTARLISGSPAQRRAATEAARLQRELLRHVVRAGGRP